MELQYQPICLGTQILRDISVTAIQYMNSYNTTDTETVQRMIHAHGLIANENKIICRIVGHESKWKWDE